MADMIIHSVQKALRLLDILSFEDKGNGFALKDLSLMINQKPTTVQNILKTMIKCGYVKQDISRNYFAGRKVFEIRQFDRIHLEGGLYDEIQKLLITLGNEFGEELAYACLINGRRTTLFRYECANLIKINYLSLEVYNFFKLDIGRVLAAFSDSSSLDDIIEKNGLPGENWNNINNMDDLEKTLAQVRKKGYSQNSPDEEMTSLAVPVKVHPLGAIGYFSPHYRFNSVNKNIILKKLQEAAFQLEVFAGSSN